MFRSLARASRLAVPAAMLVRASFFASADDQVCEWSKRANLRDFKQNGIKAFENLEPLERTKALLKFARNANSLAARRQVFDKLSPRDWAKEKLTAWTEARAAPFARPPILHNGFADVIKPTKEDMQFLYKEEEEFMVVYAVTIAVLLCEIGRTTDGANQDQIELRRDVAQLLGFAK